MKFVIKSGVRKENAEDLAKAMFETCYNVSQRIKGKTDISRAFKILAGFVGVFGNSEFCESSNFKEIVKFFLSATQGLGRNKSEGRILMHYCIDVIILEFPDFGIFRVQKDNFTTSIPILTFIDNWLSCENSTLEDL